jgi:hypothetical protein
MGNRTRKIIAVAVAALAVTTACGEGGGSSSAASDTDTPDGKRYRKPPAPYAELTTGDPVSLGRNSRREAVAVEVTDTYGVPLKPKATAVVRDAEGAIVGGMDSHAMAQVQPGASARTKFFDRSVRDPRLAEGTVECYVDPMLGRMITSTPVWIDIS